VVTIFENNDQELSMSDASNVAKKLGERFGGTTEDRLGKALSDLLENPLLTGAIGRAFDAREKASQAQEVAFSALNLPSAADIERLTRRLRSVSQRLEGIEDGVDRLDRGQTTRTLETRLSAIEQQLEAIAGRIERLAPATGSGAAPSGAAATDRANTRGASGRAASPRSSAAPAARAAKAAKRSGGGTAAKAKAVNRAKAAAKAKDGAGRPARKAS
jgi:hypothetical protein